MGFVRDMDRVLIFGGYGWQQGERGYAKDQSFLAPVLFRKKNGYDPTGIGFTWCTRQLKEDEFRHGVPLYLVVLSSKPVAHNEELPQKEGGGSGNS